MEKRSRATLAALCARIFCTLLILCVSLPSLASAHETFVLPQADIARIEALTTHINVFESLLDPYQLFLFLLYFVVVLGVLMLATVQCNKPWAHRMTKFFVKFERMGIRILRIAFGLALILAGFYQTLFLPDMVLSGGWGVLLAYAQVCLGFLLVFDFATDVVALACVGLYVVALIVFHGRAIDHIDVLGVALYLLYSHHGQTGWFTRLLDPSRATARIYHYFKANAFDILRILFGASLIVSGVTKKLIAPEYFLRVVDTFSLAAAFGLDPVFLTLMAGLTEVMLGLVLITGIQARTFTAVSIVLFTMMGVMMREALIGHLIIYAILILILTHKQTKQETLSLEKKWEKLVGI